MTASPFSSNGDWGSGRVKFLTLGADDIDLPVDDRIMGIAKISARYGSISRRIQFTRVHVGDFATRFLLCGIGTFKQVVRRVTRHRPFYPLDGWVGDFNLRRRQTIHRRYDRCGVPLTAG